MGILQGAVGPEELLATRVWERTGKRAKLGTSEGIYNLHGHGGSYVEGNSALVFADPG
jgi:hypothetical protein